MLLVALEPIAVAKGVTIAAGAGFETDEHALSERHVAELLAIGAALRDPQADWPPLDQAPASNGTGPGAKKGAKK